MPATLSPAIPEPAGRDQSLQEELLEEMFAEVIDDAAPAAAGSAATDRAAPGATAFEATASDVTETGDEQPEVDSPPAADPFASQRAELQRLIDAASRVPPAVRRRLAAAIERVAWDEAGREQPALAVGEILGWLDRSLPPQFALDQERLVEKGHPAGDAFFSGQAELLNDEQAARIAAEQLAATGFAPRS